MAIANTAATVAEEVAQNLEGAAEVTRQINTAAVAAFLGGTGFGTALGFIFGYRFGKERVKKEAFEASEQEIEAIRESYRLQIQALKSDESSFVRRDGEIVTEAQGTFVPAKPAVDEIIRERGYHTAARSETEDTMRPLPPPVPFPAEPPVTKTVEVPVSATHIPPEGLGPEEWNDHFEKSKRTGARPYILHEDEWAHTDLPGYRKVTYTWYDGDNVLTDEDEEPINNVEELIGLENLRFGHGSSDDDVVFIRNDQARLEIEIMRSKENFRDVVLGLDSNEPS
jgi:hypothetical protein